MTATQEAAEGEGDLRKTSEGLAAMVEALIAADLHDLAYDIVRVRLSGERRAKLQIMIERQDGCAITVEDCAAASRAVSAKLDVEDPIRQAYVLEVSSPGIDRPLTRLSDFTRFAGHEARLELNRLLDGRKRFSGILAGTAGVDVLLDCEGERLALPFRDLVKAKLVLTDALIAEQQAAEAAAAEALAAQEKG
ncbi:MAG: ribosome maturation factor RimP [Pseudomonadota bacterium]